MHPAAYKFVERCKAAKPEFFAGSRVLEIGSYDVNGTVRPLFAGCAYLGVDVRPGPA